jgi:hypothetical protein
VAGSRLSGGVGRGVGAGNLAKAGKAGAFAGASPRQSQKKEGAIDINDSSPPSRKHTVRNNIVRDSTTTVIE